MIEVHSLALFKFRTVIPKMGTSAPLGIIVSKKGHDCKLGGWRSAESKSGQRYYNNVTIIIIILRLLIYLYFELI